MQRLLRLATALLLIGVAAGIARAAAPWVRGNIAANLEKNSLLERVFYRLMDLPGGAVPYPRPPGETRPALTDALHNAPTAAHLYMLRALEDERQLDVRAAETDWRQFAEKAADRAAANLELADFYQRHVRPRDELKALRAVGQSASPSTEALTPPLQQRSWKAFERMLRVIEAQALGVEAAKQTYREWLVRYPGEASLQARYFAYLLSAKQYDAAQSAIAEYSRKFPNDLVFPLKSRAMLEYSKGSVEDGLAVYDRAFQPLWPAELVQSYFDLLKVTYRERQFLERARSELSANPDNIAAVTRIFFYYQQQGKNEAAQQAITAYRLRKEERKAAWSSEELYTLARLLRQIHAYPESARYYYALYNSRDLLDARERALADIIALLLEAPEQPIRIGAGELSMYRDIATLDQGPGYLNGILSLIYNSLSIDWRYSEEETKAVPYFHRAAASELLTKFNGMFPQSSRRPELNQKLIEAYAGYGQNEAVLRSGHRFLQAFPKAPQRTEIGFLMADAFARTGQTQQEFALYDSLLQELAAKAQHVPLGELAAPNSHGQSQAATADAGQPVNQGEPSEQQAFQGRHDARLQARQRAFSFASASPVQQEGARLPEYARVLDRYLARLAQQKQVPQALAVLRREIDRNPNDPGIYERLAQFLDQNQLWTEQEEIYRRAIQQFSGGGWYDKLARWYLRQKRNDDFQKLTEEITRIFSGTDLEAYFRQVVRYGQGPQLYVRLNAFAHERFPHNLVFVRNLLTAYRTKGTANSVLAEVLLRNYWFEDAQLRSQFFELLSSRGTLDAELRKLETIEPAIHEQNWSKAAANNPAAVYFYATATEWRSHFEASAPALGALADADPTNERIVREVSAVFRSLAYTAPANTERAVAVERNLLKAYPGRRDILSRIGDIYADRGMFKEAAPYWLRMPSTEPGNATAYLDAATVFWDYYRFDQALELLNQGRRRLGEPSLYGYEAGAIYENKRDYDHAIAEYMNAALTGPAGPSVAATAKAFSRERGSAAEDRLLQLARSASQRQRVDEATARAVDVPSPPLEAIRLRIAVLEAQNRKAELGQFLIAMIDRISRIELLEELEAIAQQKSLEQARERALERQANLSQDPVRRLELGLQLVRFFEARGDLPAAQHNIEELYRDNGKILGVVRATVDFYWRSKMPQKAIDVLLQAAKDSYPDAEMPGFKTQFTFEAARKMTEAGQYQTARDLLLKLLAGAPANPEYLAAMADTYARAKDDHGLRDFYLTKLNEFRKAKTDSASIAALRRGLILALVRLNDDASAIEQYIEIMNQYPEDEALATEAALFAQRYGQAPKLVAFYTKTVTDSPRDSRWAVVLARIQANLENYPAAVDAYSRAIAIRPDRTDLRTARAALNERLMRFDDAVADYTRLYELTYHNARWMEKVAEARARQANPEAVIAALRTALIEGRPENPANYFEVAGKLESWGMLAQALEFAEQGAKSAGDEFLTGSEYRSGVRLFARLAVRTRGFDAAYTRLWDAGLATKAMPASLAVLHQVEQGGTPSGTDAEWRKHEQKRRADAAREGLRQALREMGVAVDRYYTPEERTRFVQFLEEKRSAMNASDTASLLLPVAVAANLADLEARWRYQLLTSSLPDAGSQAQPLSTLERRQLKYADLAQQIERYAASLSLAQRMRFLAEAAGDYRAAEDTSNELRVLEQLDRTQGLGSLQHRYFQLLLAARPRALVEMSERGDEQRRNAAANYLVENAATRLVLDAVRSRAAGLPPVWQKAYTGLVGLYLRETGTEINAAFLGALGDATIGQRLAAPVDRSQQLAGAIWFYYASRYGEYRAIANAGDAEDFLPASLELHPASPDAYFELADYYAETGGSDRALADFEHVIELAPARADAHDRMAVLYWEQGKREQAIAQWKQALDGWLAQVNTRKVPAGFWPGYTRTLRNLGARKLVPEFHDQIDLLLRTYVRRNGSYESQPLLRSTFLAAKDPATAVPWLLDLALVAPDPSAVISPMMRAAWIPLANREPFYRKQLELTQQRAAESQGMAREYANNELLSRQIDWVDYLLEVGDAQRAQAALNAIAPELARSGADQLVVPRLRVAARIKMLDVTLDSYRHEPDRAPKLPLLEQAARVLQQAGDKPAAQQVLEYVFTRQIEEHQLSAPAFLGLAEIRLDVGDTEKALLLLRRMTMLPVEGFENLDSAAALLMKHNHPAEALEFLQQLCKAVPWEPDYRVRMAQAQIQEAKDTGSARAMLVAVASSREPAYSVRVSAAKLLGGLRSNEQLESGELTLLAMGVVPISKANQTFYYDARLAVAEQSANSEAKLPVLRATVEDWPLRDAPRFMLFKVALAFQKYQLAINAATPLLQGGLGSPATAEEQPDESEEAEPDWAAQYALQKVPEDQRATFACGLGEALQRLNRPQEALRYLRVAEHIENAPANRKELQNRLAQVRDELRLRAANERRRPAIQSALEQNRTVRPRLVTRSAPQPHSSVQTGGVR
jgi:tetratricopeptide (TPR) repeat protein